MKIFSARTIARYGRGPGTAVISSDRGVSRRNPLPEKTYSGKKICVTGTISNYRGREIVVKDPSQIAPRD